MRRVGRAGAALTMAVAVVLAGVWGYGRLAALWTGDPVPTYQVEEQPFVRRVTAEGNLRAVEATPLVAPPEADGPLKIAWMVKDGSHVEPGDVVIRFDPSDMRRELAEGRAEYETATSKIAREEAQVASALRNRERTAELSERELETTRAFQPKNEVIFSRNQIIESAIDEDLSAARRAHADRTKDIEKSLSRSKLELLAIDKRAAEQSVAQAHRALESMTLTAPHAGVVVFKRDRRGNELHVGDTVWSGQPLAELPHLDAMEAEVFVLEADAGGLEPGRPATVVIDAYPDRAYQAVIERVDTLAKPRFPDVPVQYFGVILALERTDEEVMKPGQRVRATLTLGDLDDREALVVPRQAIFREDGKTIVYRQVSGDADGSAGIDGFEAVEVELGASTPGRVVIERGLAAGDRVALRDPTRPVSAPGAGERDDQTPPPGAPDHADQ